MKSKNQILEMFSLFSVTTGGIGSWITPETHDDIFERLGSLDEHPMSAVQLNQLLVLGHEAPASDGFFNYYWMQAPTLHPYPVREVPGFSDAWLSAGGMIRSLEHLRWGLYRLYADALLYVGNVRTAYRRLRELSFEAIAAQFRAKRYDTESIERRGPALRLRDIARDNRYLISEMACKSYGDESDDGDMRKALLAAYKAHTEAGRTQPTVRELLENKLPHASRARQKEFIFSAEELLADDVTSEQDLIDKYDRIAARFSDARSAALQNTRLYLSMLSDLDVYVATSMRSRQDFRNMAETCDSIFAAPILSGMNLRYFDPTMSAAGGHEDKGLIECLMVKCAKLLIYCAGERESYGKDAEAAMALSLGKPVIFFCDEGQRGRFYRDVHPLSRLIEFDTGIAVGAMVTDKLADVPELISRILCNRMAYYLEQPKPGFLRLKEKLTGSVVRLQTSDRLLAETFWNHYHQGRDSRRPEVGGMS